MFDKARAKIANAIAPPKSTQTGTIHRFVKVRFFLPQAGHTDEIYDRENAGAVKAWDENQRLYRCQVIGYAAEYDALDNGA